MTRRRSDPRQPGSPPGEVDYPGVYIEELPDGVRPIAGVNTSSTAFIGRAQAGPIASATEVGSFVDYVRAFGAADPQQEMAYAVHAFYANGGGEAHVVRVAEDNTLAEGLQALDAVAPFGLLCLPGETDLDVLRAALAYAAQRQAFLLVDPPGVDLQAAVALAKSLAEAGGANAALYYPPLREPGEDGGIHVRAPSGGVAGVYARTDRSRGVWAPPAGANAVLLGIAGVAEELREPELSALQADGVNAIRTLPGGATVLWGGRTVLGTDPSGSGWQYVNVRRLNIYLEQSLDSGLQWTVFEPNNERLWARVRVVVGAFMDELWHAGALQGRTPSEAFFVRCDRSTMSQDDLDGGRLRVEVGFAPLKPGEFVVLELTRHLLPTDHPGAKRIYKPAVGLS